MNENVESVESVETIDCVEPIEVEDSATSEIQATDSESGSGFSFGALAIGAVVGFAAVKLLPKAYRFANRKYEEHKEFKAWKRQQQAQHGGPTIEVDAEVIDG